MSENNHSIFLTVDENTFWTPDMAPSPPRVGKKTPFPPQQKLAPKPKQNQESIPIYNTPRFWKLRGENILRARRINFDIPEVETPKRESVMKN